MGRAVEADFVADVGVVVYFLTEDFCLFTIVFKQGLCISAVFVAVDICIRIRFFIPIHFFGKGVAVCINSMNEYDGNILVGSNCGLED